MDIFALLAGIVIAATVFSALLWSIYRSVVTQERQRLNYTLLSLSTLLVVTAITYNLTMLLLMAGITTVGTGLFAIIAEHRWSKLLPLVQIVLGGLAIFAAIDVLLRAVVSSGVQNSL